VGSCEPDPLGADVVHVGEDCGDGADVAERFGLPCGGIEMLDEELVQMVVQGEDVCGISVEVRVALSLTLGHGSAP
jgi:hypothetical protein